MQTVEVSSLLEVVTSMCPGTEVEATSIGNCTVIGFYHGDDVAWVAFEDHSPERGAEHGLVMLANRLALCENCQCSQSPCTIAHCRGDYRLMARRLRELFGRVGYQRFLAHAPVRLGIEVD
jgi:hypothetical protein